MTGCHKTSSWACAAFTRRSKEVNLEFNVAAGATQGGVWGRWSTTYSPGVWRHSGPVRLTAELEEKPDENLPTAPQTEEALMATDDSGNGNLYAPILCLVTSSHRGLIVIARLSQSTQMEGMSRWCAADVKQRGVPVGSTIIQDQAIFIRGYKICDRHTGLARIRHRKCLKYDKNGFILIPPRDEEVIRGSSRQDEDEDKEGDPSGSHQDHPSRPPNNPSSSFSDGKGGASSSTSGGSDGNSSPSSENKGGESSTRSRGSDGNSTSSDSVNMDASELGTHIDEDLALYLRLNCDKVCIFANL